MRKTVAFACLLALYTPGVFAQSGKPLPFVRTTQTPAIHVQPQETPAGLQLIYSNLGSSKTGLYNATAGWPVAGPNSQYQRPYSVALPFTPKSDSHVSRVRVAVVYFGSGADQVNLSIYGDTSGVPGTWLAGPVTVTNLPDGCCTLALADFPSTAVTGGTQYWVVADTPLTGTGSDFAGLWDWSVTPIIALATDYGSGWLATNGDGRPAGEVLGTIP